MYWRSKMLSSAIASNFKPFSIRVKTLTYHNGKEFAAHGLIDQQLNSNAYFARYLLAWSEAAMKAFMGCFANTPKRSEPCLRLVKRKLG